MIVTKYSLMMGIVWFTCVTFLGSCLLSREKGRTFQIVALVFLLGAARALLPVEILHGHVVQCWNLYPQVRDLWNLSFSPGLTVLRPLPRSGRWEPPCFWWGWRPRSGGCTKSG